MRKLLHLFLMFFKIGLFTFGGGYAMLPLLQAEIVKKRRWATDEELLDLYSIGQCTPGIISVNVATFMGYRAGRHRRSLRRYPWHGDAVVDYYHAVGGGA